MPTDFTAYTDPGIYIEMIEPPVNRTSAITPTVVALIGSAGSEGREIVESTAISSQSSTTLINKGIKPFTLNVKNRLSLEQYTSAAFGTVNNDVASGATTIYVRKMDDKFTLPSGVALADFAANVKFEVRIDNQTYGVTGYSLTGDVYQLTVTPATSSAIEAGKIVNLVAHYMVPIKIGTLNASSEPDLAAQSNLTSTVTEFRILQNMNSIQRVRIATAEEDVVLEHGTSGGSTHFKITLPDTDISASDVYDLIFDSQESDTLSSVYADQVAVYRVVGTGYVDYFFVLGFASPALLTETNANTTVTAVGLSVNDRIVIDKERMEIEAVTPVSTNGNYKVVELSVVRGREGTKALGHGKRDVYWASGYDYYVNNELAELGNSDDDITILSSVSGGRLALLNGQGGVIASSENVEVAAYSSDSNQFAVESFSDLDNVRSKYGLPVTGTSTLTINSNLTLAAQLAMRNGASQVYCVSVDENTLEGFEAAIDKLASFDDINVIVPLTIGLSDTDTTSVINKVRQFCTEQANLGNLVRAFVALDGTTTSYAAADFKSLAENLANSRISLVAPSLFTLQTSSGRLSAGGPFAAAAIAGLQANFDAQVPLTRKTLDRSVYAIEDAFTRTEMLELQSKGVLVLFQDRTGALSIRHGLTTDMSSVYNQEISVVTARDRLRDLFYDSLQGSGILGSPITANTQELVVSNVIGALEFAKRATLIFDYADVKYRIPTSNPTAVEIRFAYRPTMPLNYVLVQFSVDTSNSSVTFQSVTEGGV